VNKGRPDGSIIRNRIILILNEVKTSYGYEIFTIYKKLFGRVHIRSIYYNLKKGIEKEEIIVVNVSREIGDYSWGDEVEKIYYTLGPYAKVIGSKEDLEKLAELKLNKKDMKIDWEKEIKNIIIQLKKDINNYKERYEVLSSQGKKLLKEKILEKLKKIKSFSLEKISSEKIEKMLEGINPDTL